MAGAGTFLSAQCFQSKLSASPHGFGFPSVPSLTSLHPQLSHRDMGSSLCCTFPNSSEKQLKTVLMGEQIPTTPDLSQEEVQGCSIASASVRVRGQHCKCERDPQNEQCPHGSLGGDWSVGGMLTLCIPLPLISLQRLERGLSDPEHLLSL